MHSITIRTQHTYITESMIDGEKTKYTSFHIIRRGVIQADITSPAYMYFVLTLKLILRICAYSTVSLVFTTKLRKLLRTLMDTTNLGYRDIDSQICLTLAYVYQSRHVDTSTDITTTLNRITKIYPQDQEMTPIWSSPYLGPVRY